MTSPLTVYKLIILYMLQRLDGPMSKSRISEFLLGNGYVNMISLMQTYTEIEENGLVESKDNGGQTFLTITQEGRDSLRFFASGISDEIKAQADEYLTKNGVVLRNEEDLIAEYYRASAGGYEARVGVRENKDNIIEIRLSVPDRETAERITRNWKEKNQEIYEYLIEKLF